MKYWYYRISDGQVVDEKPRAADAIGPFKTAAEAKLALVKVKERNRIADAEDAAWRS